MVTRLLIVSLVLVNLKSIHCISELVYVSPNSPNPDCHDGLPCQTLKSYFNNKTLTQRSINLTMIFLVGEHVGGGQRIALKFTSFTVRGAGKLGVVIKDVNIELQYATEIRFENVALVHWNSASPCPPFLVFQMLSVSAENQTHFFIEHATNSSGNKIKLVNSVFRSSSLSGKLSFTKSEWNAEAMSLTSSTLNIGNNTNITFMHNRVQYAVLFLNSSKLNVESNVHMAFVSNSRAMAIFGSTLNVMTDTNMTFISNSKVDDEGVAMFVVHSTLNVEGDLHFINNSAESEAAINFQMSTLNIRNCARINFVNNSASVQAGAILLEKSVLNAEDNTNIAFINNSAGKIGSMAMLSSTLHIRHNASFNFISNSVSTYGGSIEAELSTVTIENNAHIAFTNNTADTAGAMALRSSIFNIGDNAHISFNSNSAAAGGALYALNCTINVINHAQMTFINNSAFVAGAFALISSELYMKSHTILTFINNTAISFGGALFTYRSKFSIENAANMMTTKFVNNSAANGGAMALLSSKFELINGNSNLTFEKNSAKELGGAIYVDPDQFQCTLQAEDNYYLLDTHCLYDTNPSTTEQYFYFVNNLAQIAGDDIYGASLAWCNGSVVHTGPKNSSLSSISGAPSRVCRCDKNHKPLCHNISHNHFSLSFYPGEMITISVVVVGGDWGATPGTVYARFQQPYTSSILKPSSQYTQWINATQCDSLNYTVYSNQSVQLVLSALSHSDLTHFQTCDNNVTQEYYAKSCSFSSPLYINFKFLPCPPGFSLYGDPPGCYCYTVLTDNGVNCNIFRSEATLSWNTSLWITMSVNKIILSKHCPFDYCKDTKVIKGISDDQCSFNRGGQLCGGCKENYSLAIGSSHCIYCTNDNNVTLLIFFAAAGFLLVFFIGVLNLTVTQGMINGLVFYANIVWTYQSVLFPNRIPSELIFFKAFIAWLNLDFGIEMCFINNLNAFWKSWLQFVFPFYLWSIAGLMVMLARYSTRLTILFGNRAVSVLATLILLSYMKLLRTAVEILHFSILTVYDNSNDTTVASLVWSVDGTLDYFGYPHTLLLVAALFTLLFMWLPYTLLLLLIQWIRRFSHYRLLKWIIRLNPFYDANLAPLKHKHQYWFGLLLLSRGIIFVTFASNFSIPEDINLLILLIFTGLLFYYMLAVSIYKSHALLVFHGSFFLNICFLSGFIIFSHTKSKIKSSIQTSAALLSTGVAFLQFCCIILYQIYSLCRSCGVGRSLSKVRVNEEQVRAILDISSRLESHKYSAEKQPLLDPNHSDSDGPTY